MHLTLMVTLLVTLCYSSPFDFENYNIQWEVPLPVGNVPDLSLPEESNLSEVTTVIPVVILADMHLTPVDQDMADILDDRKANLTGVPTEFWVDNFVDDSLNMTDFSGADSGLNLTYDPADRGEPSPAQMTLTLNLNSPNDTLDYLVDEASDLVDQAINASSYADPDDGPHPSDLSAWKMLTDFIETEGGLAVLFTVITIGQFPTCIALHLGYLQFIDIIGTGYIHLLKGKISNFLFKPVFETSHFIIKTAPPHLGPP